MWWARLFPSQMRNSWGIEAAGIPKGSLALTLHPAPSSVFERGILYMCYAYFLSLAQSNV